ncbi:hypothetical protein D3C87_1626330 [compost metagenome]
MHQTILVNANIHESTEIRDVRYDTWADHTFLKVFHFKNIIAELEGLKRITRVTSRLFKFFDDVIKRKLTHKLSPFCTRI